MKLRSIGKQTKLNMFHVRKLDTQQTYYDYQELLTVGWKFRSALDLPDWYFTRWVYSTAEKAKGKTKTQKKKPWIVPEFVHLMEEKVEYFYTITPMQGVKARMVLR